MYGKNLTKTLALPQDSVGQKTQGNGTPAFSYVTHIVDPSKEGLG